MAKQEFLPDINARLKDAGLVAADAAWQVAAANKIHDFGAATYTEFDIHILVSAIEVASTDELYELYIQLSSSATFASSIVNRIMLPLGAAAAAAAGADIGSTVGRYRIHADNEWDGTVYRYLRGYTDVTGTIATGINFQAWMTGPEG